MSPEELTGIARAVAEQLDTAVADVLRQCAAQVEALRQAHAAELAEIRRSTDADIDALQAEVTAARHQLELAEQEMQVLRSAVDTDPIAAAVIDGDSVLHLVQRGGARLEVGLPDARQIARDAVAERDEQMRSDIDAAANAAVARCFELFFNAPVWTASAVYTEGQLVQTYVGRTYRVRAGIKATIGKEPGDHPEHWERLGTGGFRVFKSKPVEPQPGDVFTEADSRFMHDGAQTILFVPKSAKVSDIERAVKGPHGLAQSAQAQARELADRIAAAEQAIQRSTTAANDAGEIGVQALAMLDQLRTDLEALQRRFDDLNGEAA